MRWLVELVIGALALTGLWVTLDKAARGAGRVWGWLVRDRVAPLLEDDDGISEDCANGDHGECEGCWCECGHDIDLPPEQSAAELGFTGPPQESPEVRHWHKLEMARKQRWTDVEAMIWAAYDALGLEGTGFTRAMAAQVKSGTDKRA